MTQRREANGRFAGDPRAEVDVPLPVRDGIQRIGYRPYDLTLDAVDAIATGDQERAVEAIRAVLDDLRFGREPVAVRNVERAMVSAESGDLMTARADLHTALMQYAFGNSLPLAALPAPPAGRCECGTGLTMAHRYCTGCGRQVGDT